MPSIGWGGTAVARPPLCRAAIESRPRRDARHRRLHRKAEDRREPRPHERCCCCCCCCAPSSCLPESCLLRLTAKAFFLAGTNAGGGGLRLSAGPAADPGRAMMGRGREAASRIWSSEGKLAGRLTAAHHTWREDFIDNISLSNILVEEWECQGCSSRGAWELPPRQGCQG